VQRGLLDVEVDDRRWAAALSPLLPKLAATLAAECPDLAVRVFRLRVRGETVHPKPSPVERAESARPAEAPAAASRTTPETNVPSSALEPTPERVRRIADRYLERKR
jgi:hypothetical protein